MYHRPGSDRHTGRHARTRIAGGGTSAATAPLSLPVDAHGRPIPAPPRPVYSDTPLVVAARAGTLDADVVDCWEALVTTDPAALGGDQAARETAYLPAARYLGAAVRAGVARPVRVAHITGALDECGHHDPLRGRSRRAAAIVNELLELRRRTTRSTQRP